jgi:hypothetical protein
MRNIMGLGLALALVGCVMEDEQVRDSEELDVATDAEEVRVESIAPDGAVAAEDEYLSQCAPAPPGSYRLTCDTVRVACDGSWMDAHCRRRNGSWMWSPTLWSPFSCAGDIANIDGTLKCPR